MHVLITFNKLSKRVKQGQFRRGKSVLDLSANFVSNLAEGRSGEGVALRKRSRNWRFISDLSSIVTCKVSLASPEKGSGSPILRGLPPHLQRISEARKGSVWEVVG
jgi:hypothetical protein